MSSIRELRARLAALSRYHGPDDPAVIATRRELQARVLAAHILDVVDNEPGLGAEYVPWLRGLLRSSNGGKR